MAKSIKLKDNTYIDSTGIVHNKKLLSEILKNTTTDINRADLNSFTSGFIAGYGHNLTNSPLPNQNQGHLLSIPRHDADGYVTQYFSPYPSNDVFVRTCEAGVWSNWVMITQNYSSAERCIGTWFGKPLYRKTINFGALPNNTLKEVAHGISNLDYVKIITGTATNGTNGVPLPRSHTGSTLNIILEYDKTNIMVATAYNFSSYSAYVTMEYTKTTD